MALTIRIPKEGDRLYTSDKRLYVDASKENIVEAGSEDAAYLLVAEGGTLTEEEAKKYGLLESTPDDEAEAQASQEEKSPTAEITASRRGRAASGGSQLVEDPEPEAGEEGEKDVKPDEDKAVGGPAETK